jgi:hypothetical protein
MRAVGNRLWCLKCGYSTSGEVKEEAVEVVAPPKRRLPIVLILLAIGCALIVAATVYRGRYLPHTSAVLIWWVAIEGGAGFAVYLAGHVWAIVATFNRWRENEIFKYLDPVHVWTYAVGDLRRAGKALCLGGWGLTAFLCAFVIFWQHDFAFKDKERKSKPLVSVSPNGKGDGKLEDVIAALVEFGSSDEAEPESEDARQVNVIDLTSDEEKERKLSVTECVVIGYVVDPQDPSRIDQLVLGIRSEDGTIRYAGTVSNFAKKPEVDKWLGQIKTLKPLLDTPGYLPGELNAVAVEPALSCKVGYTERTKEGLLKDTVVKGVAGDAPASR